MNMDEYEYMDFGNVTISAFNEGKSVTSSLAYSKGHQKESITLTVAVHSEPQASVRDIQILATRRAIEILQKTLPENMPITSKPGEGFTNHL